jgi:hypothetical protein
MRVEIEFDARGRRGDLANGDFGFVDAALTDEPPRTFRGEESSYDDWDRPYPLEGEGDAVAPLCCVFH